MSYPNAESLSVTSVLACPGVRWQCLQVLLTYQRENPLQMCQREGVARQVLGRQPWHQLSPLDIDVF